MYNYKLNYNMQRILKSIVKQLKEAEDNLFPGFDPSAFDEHEASKRVPDTVDRLTQKIEAMELASRLADRRASDIRNLLRRAGIQSAASPNTAILVKQPWIDKYPIAKGKMGGMTVDISNPNVERMVASIEKILGRSSAYQDKIKKVKSKLLRVRKKEAEDNIKTKSAATPQQQIDPKKIPHGFKIVSKTPYSSTTNTHRYENPYFLIGAGNTAFAGHPAHFTEWVGRLRTMYFEMERFIKKLGLPELDTMYASKPPGGLSVPYFYLANSDKSVIIINEKNRINVYIKSLKDPKLPLIHFRTKDISANFLKNVEQKVK